MPTHERSLTRRIDLTSLQLFVAVCETGSIGRAAEREFIAASAVSKRLSELENTLGTDLLYRHSRGVDLTPAGESLLHHARSVLYSLETMQGELSEYAEGVRGHVRVHANISAIVQYLPEDLGSFARDHAAIKIDLEEHLSSEVMRAVQEGAADLGLCHVPLDMPSPQGLQTQPYRQDQLILVAPQSHPLATLAQPISLAQALDFDHIGLHANSSVYRAMHQAALAQGRSVRLRMRVTGLDAMCRMIANGLGIGVMPRHAFELMQSGIGRSLTAITLSDAWTQRVISLVARDFDTLPVTARTLVDHLHARGAAATAPANNPIH